MVDEHFTSSVELARAKREQTVAIAMSSITVALISEVFLRDRYCGFKELKITTTGTLLTRNGGTFHRH